MQETTIEMMQSYLRDVPLIVLGSGASIPFGLPSMGDLAKHLQSDVGSIFSSNQSWIDFERHLIKGFDLESAMNQVFLDADVHNAIIRSTWDLINKADQKVYHDYVLNQKTLPLCNLFNKLLEAHPKKVTVLTTNYDRLVEYAVDQSQASICCGFSGRYFGPFKGADATPYSNNERVIKVLKVHGSLDWFQYNNMPLFLSKLLECPENYSPLIVTPGKEKYAKTHQDPYRSIISSSDDVIRNASSYLCVGYGFNDDHIHPALISEVSQKDKPLVIVTKEATDNCNKIIASAKKYLVLENSDFGNTRIRSMQGESIEAGSFWQLENLMNLIW